MKYPLQATGNYLKEIKTLRIVFYFKPFHYLQILTIDNRTKKAPVHIKPDIQKIHRMAGPVTEPQLRFIDSFIFEDLGLFLPVGGPCFYAQTPEHVHPAYMLIYSFKGEAEGWKKA